MPIIQVGGQDNLCLKVEGALDIRCAEEARRTLRDFFANSGALDLDLSAVEDCDSAGIQLLCSAVLTAKQVASPIRLLRPSRTVIETAAAIGLEMGEDGINGI